MTKKDFQVIASVLATTMTPRDGIIFGEAARILSAKQQEALAERFADALSVTNPRFNRTLFIQAATGVVPVTARKPRPEHPVKA